MSSRSNNIVVFSSCPEFWGGSEELWSQSVKILADKGYKLHILKTGVDFSLPQVKVLQDLGAEFTDLRDILPSFTTRILNRILPFSPRRTLAFYIKRVLAKRIAKLNPKLVIISQGSNFDGLAFAEYCPFDQFRYVIISQKAIKYLYPNDPTRAFMKKLWRGSARNYFVSQDNLNITEDQFGMSFENAEVVRNPYLTRVERPLEWEFEGQQKLKFACVGRFFILDKGQDILLKVLAKEKWRKRDIEVSFYGKGLNEEAIKDLAKHLDLDNVIIKGHVSDVVSIWKENQALLLPARNEGLPLVVVEAMMCGRVPIVTNVGGNTEVIEDDVTGFIADDANEKSFDEALERAWQRRGEFKEIGELAANKIRGFVSGDPAEIFAGKLEKIIDQEESV